MNIDFHHDVVRALAYAADFSNDDAVVIASSQG